MKLGHDSLKIPLHLIFKKWKEILLKKNVSEPHVSFLGGRAGGRARSAVSVPWKEVEFLQKGGSLSCGHLPLKILESTLNLSEKLLNVVPTGILAESLHQPLDKDCTFNRISPGFSVWSAGTETNEVFLLVLLPQAIIFQWVLYGHRGHYGVTNPSMAIPSSSTGLDDDHFGFAPQPSTVLGVEDVEDFVGLENVCLLVFGEFPADPVPNPMGHEHHKGAV